jgi:AcrR family transcriptional regulator
MANDTKERLIRAGEALFRSQGYSGTGLKQLADDARAPWSSMYHFFPDGKEQMAAEILDYAAAYYARMLARGFEARPDPLDAVDAIFTGEAEILKRSGFRDGCPIASVTLDTASTVEPLRKHCSEAFASWIRTIAQGIARAGVDETEATELATFVLAALEGAIVLSRASKNTAPLARTGRIVHLAVEAALKNAKRSGRPRKRTRTATS